MSGAWGGAQWVLATLFVVASVLPLGVKIAGMSTKTNFGPWYCSELFTRCCLIAILWWGGFWS